MARAGEKGGGRGQVGAVSSEKVWKFPPEAGEMRYIAVGMGTEDALQHGMYATYFVAVQRK